MGPAPGSWPPQLSEMSLEPKVLRHVWNNHKKKLRFALQGILLGRESIAKEMQDLLHEATDPWGVLVERVEVCVGLQSTNSNNICR